MALGARAAKHGETVLVFCGFSRQPRVACRAVQQNATRGSGDVLQQAGAHVRTGRHIVPSVVVADPSATGTGIKASALSFVLPPLSAAVPMRAMLRWRGGGMSFCSETASATSRSRATQPPPAAPHTHVRVGDSVPCPQCVCAHMRACVSMYYGGSMRVCCVVGLCACLPRIRAFAFMTTLRWQMADEQEGAVVLRIGFLNDNVRLPSPSLPGAVGTFFCCFALTRKLIRHHARVFSFCFLNITGWWATTLTRGPLRTRGTVCAQITPKRLAQYESAYDVVVTHDGPMDIVIQLLQDVVTSNNSKS